MSTQSLLFYFWWPFWFAQINGIRNGMLILYYDSNKVNEACYQYKLIRQISLRWWPTHSLVCHYTYLLTIKPKECFYIKPKNRRNYRSALNRTTHKVTLTISFQTVYLYSLKNLISRCSIWWIFMFYYFYYFEPGKQSFLTVIPKLHFFLWWLVESIQLRGFSKHTIDIALVKITYIQL